MSVHKLENQQLKEIKDIIQRDLKYEENLKNPKLKDFRLAFVIAKEAIDTELIRRKQYSLKLT